MATALREVFAQFTTQFNTSALQDGEAATLSATGALEKLVAAAAGAATVAALRGFVAEMAFVGDELDKTSQSIGISSRALQEWRLAAGFSGVGAEQLNVALLTLQRQTADAARGTGEGLVAFRRLGITAQDSAGQVRDVEGVLIDIARGLEMVESPAERNRLLMALLGESGARLSVLFEQGEGGIAAMREELERFGGGASPEFVAAAANITDAMARLDLSILSIRTRIAETLLPAVQTLIDGLSAALNNTELLRAGLIVLAGAALRSAAGYASAAAAYVTANAALIASWALTFAGALVLIAVIEDLIVAFEGGDAVVTDFGNSIQNYVNDLEAAGGVTARLAEIWQDAINIGEEFFALFLDREGEGGIGDFRVQQRGLVAPDGGVLAETSRRVAPAPFVPIAETAEGEGLAPFQLFGLDTAMQPPQVEIAQAPEVTNRVQVTNAQQTTIEVNGARDPRAVGVEVRRILDQRDREAAEALTQDTEGLPGFLAPGQANLTLDDFGGG